jgi:hypothetical protein
VVPENAAFKLVPMLKIVVYGVDVQLLDRGHKVDFLWSSCNCAQRRCRSADLFKMADNSVELMQSFASLS